MSESGLCPSCNVYIGTESRSSCPNCGDEFESGDGSGSYSDDEFDDDDLVYSKLDTNNFVFEGKAPLNDVARILEIDGVDFEDAKGEADTLAGLIIEVEGRIPTKNEKIVFNED